MQERSAAVKRILRRAATAASWVLSGQLQGKLAERRQRLSDADIVAKSDFFDADWYVANNADVPMSGLPPALHYAMTVNGARNPGPLFDASWYCAQNPEVAAAGLNPLVHYERIGRLEGRPIKALATPSELDDQKKFATEIAFDHGLMSGDVGDVLASRYAVLAPLRVFTVIGQPRYVTLVLDRVDSSDIFGRAATAIVFAAMLANHLGVGLRLVARQAVIDARLVGEIISINQIQWNANIDCVFSGPTQGPAVPVGDEDVFITTSWFTTQSTLGSVAAKRVIYLLQEDERVLYGSGDERVRCSAIMAESEVRLVVSTKMLFDHLTTGNASLPNVLRNGMWFEPAFPFDILKTAEVPINKKKKHFFFHARPDIPSNLFWFGLEAIRSALMDNVLNPQEWEFHFADEGLHDLSLLEGVELHIHKALSYDSYLALIGQMDIGLSLLDTPHPGYQSLGLATGGAVVVTNRHGSKQSLSDYSQDILCVNPDIPSLLAGISDAVKIVSDRHSEERRAPAVAVARDWNQTMSSCLRALYPTTLTETSHV